jgi:DNA (cytosine-5)-methyltransferase 1
MAKEFRAVDLFSGAGGFSLAAQASGFAVEFAVESDKWAAATYKRNFVDKPSSTVTLYREDINTLSPTDLKTKHFGDGKRCDLLLGGPPCQGFSAHRINDAGIDDPRNELILRYFEFVRALRPRVFLMENVPGILWPRHKPYLDSFYASAKAAGYTVLEPVILDARDYGVPQGRKRVFILGVESTDHAATIAWPPAPTHGPPPARGKTSKLKSWNACKRVFVAAPKGDENNVHMKHSKDMVFWFAATPKNGGSRKDSGRLLPCHVDHDGHKDTYGRIDTRKPAPTMTTACINPSKGRFVHPFQNHGITARQAARIQTFPDDFVFLGGLMAAGKQIGNAVPVDLGVALLTHIADFLRVEDKKAKEAENIVVTEINEGSAEDVHRDAVSVQELVEHD